ncbi:limonene-1,2-epoxide hydrolase family protein [Novosphingobium cyanobacteriorum]|uniref:Limonene-1,2-epoxide hydrolase family protein n=1 Tax=Novosphingobium cyanobacteriorum TaxID=3024215 RepID=A0ABT6CL01_9SPHN|nr:limonene-1,2-epoxide hydrolase family protein [Novosphingobium cyanobacteriorum]MDF8334595.1 limonene-1,2-epoxide hydrolase family protein [Novosphingobium cyanobacteriorum]
MSWDVSPGKHFTDEVKIRIMQDPIEVVTAFLATWDSPEGWERGVTTFFADDAVYENIGMSKSVGLEAILDFVRHYSTMTGGGWIVVRTHAIASFGNTVLTERVDDMVDGRGDVLITTPVMGAFDLRDGKIIAWRDYFDTSAINPPYDGPGALIRLPS